MAKVPVINRSSGSVGYTIPELMIDRTFGPGETKMIDLEELEKLSFQPGGSYIINEYFLIDNKEVAETVTEKAAEPEYWMDNIRIAELIRSGSVDELLDFFDFAPNGAIDILKKLSVSLPMTDTVKMGIIFDKTGFNVAKAIELAAGDEPEEKKEAPVRRVIKSRSSK